MVLQTEDRQSDRQATETGIFLLELLFNDCIFNSSANPQIFSLIG
ncbi:MAG: hypothetical protein SOZ78_06710 [Eubacteriales bacterium]|nr:hypothetical protein [Eubacteriales bacterium]